MGVENFNVIIKKYGKPQHPGKFLATVIDGNNLFFIKIQSAIGQLYKNLNISSFKGINMNILDQIKRVVSQVVKDCGSLLKHIQREDNSENIYIVFDPNNTPEYIFADDMLYTDNVFVGDTPFVDLILEGKTTKMINMKADEQEKRKQAMQNKTDEAAIINSIKHLTEDELTQEALIGIYSQSSFFAANTINTTKLMRITIAELYKYIHSENFMKNPEQVHFIQSQVEADLAIRNLGQMLILQSNDENNRNILVLSSDTDYYVLFGDCPTAYCRSLLASNQTIYNPVQIFRALLKEHYSYDIIIRLSPMLGNDYTVHKGICNAKDVERILYLFGINGDYENLRRLSGNTTLAKVYKANIGFEVEENMYDSGPSSMKLIRVDEYLKNWDSLYYQRYIKSILIYKNIGFYADYSEFNISEEDIMLSYGTLQRYLFKFMNKLYDWDYQNVMDSAFINSITEIEFNSENPKELYMQIGQNSNISENDFEDMPDIFEDE